jgi:hypothetical protein
MLVLTGRTGATAHGADMAAREVTIRPDFLFSSLLSKFIKTLKKLKIFIAFILLTPKLFGLKIKILCDGNMKLM